ncbi:polysaccharide deacetylase [Arthrobacter sp. FB24]|uniref:polysaccharide deacetylase family protein n=1 Tax=Arthrobacter sp. (strain FB24) TaxID=290399 RepID=UPI00005273F0|nr:polysaccharide deacetylase family protein [Arthrobacter sp. FB24]ABK03717.1 polysaccharide deacetylase [Arthrobacter sp. FB24]
MRWSNQPVRKPARCVADPPEPLAEGRHGRRWVAVLGALLLAVSTVAGVAGTSKAAAPTIVSLTFDDGLGSQLAAAQELKAHGLVGTFFITTSFVGQSGFLTQANLNTLVADGNEIGGHSVTHPDMTTLSAAAASAEACNSKSTLEAWGFTVRNFAYPFAAVNQTAQNAVSGCGYSSSRGLGDIRSPASCADCPVAETLPPQEPMVTKAPDQVAATWTLADLQATVTNAETTGGWLQLTFHEIANGTDPSLSISPALFKEFVTWLAARTANGTTSVRTVAQALGQSPVTSPPPSPSPSPSPTPSPSPAGSFTDVPANSQFYTEISWLASQGISTGWVEANGTSTYRPALAVNRDAMAAFMYRLAGSPAYTPPGTSPFIDVTPQTQFYKEIAWLASKGISTGWDEGNGAKSYRPLQTVNRDAMAAFMYRFAGSPAYNAPGASLFTDVVPQTQFYKEINWLASMNISTGWVEGNGTRTFRPVQSVNRDAMAAFMYRYNNAFPA